jgi:hypothetical protein
VNTPSRHELGHSQSGTRSAGVSRRAGRYSVRRTRSVAAGKLRASTAENSHLRPRWCGRMFSFSPEAMRGSVVKIEMVPACTGAVFPAPVDADQDAPTVTSQRASSRTWHSPG